MASNIANPKAELPSDDRLKELAANAAARKNPIHHYAGEVLPQEAFAYANANPSIIVDVRTSQEWNSTGVPDLSHTPSKLVKLSWKTYPSYAINPDFIGEFSNNKDVGKDTALFFLCRVGGRSLDAAMEMAALGYKNCFNITGGFEGDGVNAGWKSDNLPWVQG